MKIFDNFVPVGTQNNIISTLLNPDFPWFYQADTYGEDVSNYRYNASFGNTVESMQFVHVFCFEGRVTSDYYHIITPLLSNMEEKTGVSLKNPYRIKANFLPQNPSFNLNDFHSIHSDFSKGHMTLLYYPITSDGDTFMFNERLEEGKFNLTLSDRITPKQGRAVLFNSNQLHASSSPVVSTKRLAINVVFGY